MTYARHTTIDVQADGAMSRRTGQLPAVVVLPPVRVSMPEKTDHRLAARLLRKLADELELQPA